MRTIRSSCLVLALCASSCARHVTLKAPTADAAPEDRLKAYEALAPSSLRIIKWVGNGSAARGGTSTDSLALADGRRVYHVDDLLPVVDPKSQTVADIAAADEAGRKASYTFLGGVVAMVAGAVLMGVDLASSSKRGVPFYAGAGLGVGGIISIPIANMFGRQAGEARTSAFLHYDEGLRQRLDLCRDEQEVTPCH
jgi:hypothetical protein